MKTTVFAVSLFLLFSFSIASAQLSKMTVGYGSISAAQLPVWVAKEAGIFSKNGLDVQLVFFKGSTTAVMALLSRETPISQVTGPPIVNAGLRGGDSVFVAGGAVIIDYWLMSRADIKTAEQLKGGSVAISRFGSSSDFIARYALQKVGLTPGKDVTIVQIGSTTARVDAALTGIGLGTNAFAGAHIAAHGVGPRGAP